MGDSHSALRSCIYPLRNPDKIDEDGNRMKKYKIVTPFFVLNAYINFQNPQVYNQRHEKQSEKLQIGKTFGLEGDFFLDFRG